jgi:hypothetical protein
MATAPCKDFIGKPAQIHEYGSIPTAIVSEKVFFA